MFFCLQIVPQVLTDPSSRIAQISSSQALSMTWGGGGINVSFSGCSKLTKVRPEH